ncbi:MAG: hypothetical protein CME93_02815 [Hyphomonadaceae bacterium]|nr:hypothetical protein [Hyphomonadaceae bacterium]OUX94344.1 MAG: hypothetical protein CBB77_04400 [Hyphomonas sp. TMED17]CAI8292665.1 MAG: Chemotaxis protein methyltransferase Cher2 [Hyphomonas sp. TMED17]
MQDSSFNILADLALMQSGQKLDRSQSDMITMHLASLLRRENFQSLDDLVQCLKARPNARFEAEVASNLVTRKTRFFDAPRQLEAIINVIKWKCLETGPQPPLKIWFPGTSTGQDVYSLIIRLLEETLFKRASRKIEIVGTDINEAGLKRAKAGAFSHFEVQTGLSVQRLLENFSPLASRDWVLRERVRKKAKFKIHNLIKDDQSLGRFDIVICRNVLAEMAPEQQKKAVSMIEACLMPEGQIYTAPADHPILDEHAGATATIISNH